MKQTAFLLKGKKQKVSKLPALILGLFFLFLLSFTLYRSLVPSRTPAAEAAASWYNSSWAYRIPITIDHNLVASSSPASTYANFPLLVSLSSNAGLSANASTTGADILFTASDGVTKLNHQIEYYASTTGQLVSWVKMSSIATTTDTVIYMYYGNAAAASQQNAAAAWDSSYAGVWHLNALNGTTSVSTLDSTANHNDGTFVGASVSTSTTAKIGAGGGFDGNGAISIGNTASLQISGNITMCAWVLPTKSSSNFIMAKSDGTTREYALYDSNSHYIQLYSGASSFNSNPVILSRSAWQYVCAVVNNSNVSLYLNASSTPVSTGTTTIASPNKIFAIGRDGSAGQLYFSGIMDEARVSNVARSSDWIKTEYNNQNSPSTFYSLGSVETATDLIPSAPQNFSAAPDSGQASLSWTSPSSSGGSALTGYQVSYKLSSDSSYIVASTTSSSTLNYTVTGLTNGLGYDFQVTAQNSYGTSLPASALGVVPVGYPSSPQSLSAVAGNASASLSWSAPVSNGGSAITDYIVQYRTNPAGSWTTFNDGVSANTTSTVTSLTNGTAYDFQVFAQNSYGTSTPSGIASATPYTVPDAPIDVSATAGNEEVVISFSTPSFNGGRVITGYTVSASPGGFTASASSSPITVTGLTNGTAYTFTAVASNLAGNSASSSPVVATPTPIAPSVPRSLYGIAGNEQVSLYWTIPSSNGGSAITDYIVQYRTNPAGSWTTFNDGVSANTTSTVTSLTNGTAYDFQVFAQNSYGTSTSASVIGVTPATFDAQSHTWNFAQGSDYTFDSNLVQISSGASLKGKADWYDTSWKYRKSIAVDPTKVGGSDLANFPVYYDLGSDSDIQAKAKANGLDVVFTGSDGATLLPFEVPNAGLGQVASTGAWNWISGPLALRYVGTKDQTYFSYMTSTGYVYAAAYNNIDHTVTSFDLAAGQFETDDHDAASWLALDNSNPAYAGRLVAFYEIHNGDAFYRITTNPEDITSWGAAKNWTTVHLAGDTGHAYAAPFQMADGSIWVFFRSSLGQHWAMAKTDSAATLDANTWGPALQFADTNNMYNYTKAAQSADRTKIHISFSSTHPDYGPSDLYYGNFDGNNFRRADGTIIGSTSTVPIAAANWDKIWDDATDGDAYYGTSSRAWIYDVAVDSNGYPVIAFTVYPGATETSDPDHRYWYARWNGSSWVKYEISPGGTHMGDNLHGTVVFYSGGVALDQSNPNVVYLTRNNDTPNYILEKKVTADLGATWTTTVLDSSGDSYRPVVAWGPSSETAMRLLYMKGSYPGFNSYTTSVATYPVQTRLGWLKEAHVKLPAVSASTSTTFYMYYGKTGAADLSDSSSVWSDYSLVDQFSETDMGFYALDSTANAFTLSRGLKYRPSPAEVAGKMGRAFYYANTGGGPTFSASTLNIASDTAMTQMGWVKTAAANGSGMIASNWNDGESKARFYTRIGSATHKLECYVQAADATVVGGAFNSTTDISDGNWHHYACQYDASGPGMTAVIDGGLSTTTYPSTKAISATSSSPLFLGYSVHNAVSMNGYLDQWRYARSLLGLSYIQATYNNQNDASAFYNAGTEQTLYSSAQPTVRPAQALNIPSSASFTGFSETATKNGGEIKYQLSNDGGTTWYWYNGGWTQATGGYSQANTASEINSTINSLQAGNGQFMYRAYLDSAGFQTVNLSSVVLSYQTPNNVSPEVPASGGGGAVYPSISQQVFSVADTSALVSWKTNYNTTSEIHYGTSTAYTFVKSDATATTTHSVLLENLSPSTTYRLVIKASFGGSNATSNEYIFTTLAKTVNSTSSSTPSVLTPPAQQPTVDQQPQRLINDQGTYYLITSGQRRGVTNPGILYSYGLEFKDAVPATNSDRVIPVGSPLFPGNGSLVKSKQDPTVYFISNNQRYPFTSENVFKGLGFKFSSVLVVTDPELQALPKAPLLGNASAAHLPGTVINHLGTIYWITPENTREAYSSLAIYNSWHKDNDFSKVVNANTADLSLPISGLVKMRVIE